MPYQRGAIVVQQPPSIWHFLLGGIGQGITQGVEKAMRESEQRRTTVRNFLTDVISGRIDPRITGTTEFEQWAKSQNVWEHPSMQNVIGQGKQLMGRPEVGPAQPVTMANYRAMAMEEQRRLEIEKQMEKGDIDLYFWKQKRDIERFEKEQDRQKQAEILDEIIRSAEEKGVDIERMTVNVPGLGTMTIAGAYGKLKDELKREEDASKQYWTRLNDLSGTRAKYIQTLTQVAAGKRMSLLEQLLPGLDWSKKVGKSEQDFERLPEKERVILLSRAFNDDLKNLTDAVNESAKESKKRTVKFEPINPTAVLKGDVNKLYGEAPPRKPYDEFQARGKVITPDAPINEKRINKFLGDVDYQYRSRVELKGDVTKSDLIDYLKSNKGLFLVRYDLTEKEFEEAIKRIEEGKQ